MISPPTTASTASPGLNAETLRISPPWDLRHWSASVAIAQGHDVRTVAGRLGHANPAMTLRVYAHAFGAADQALATSLGDILKRNDA